MKKNNNIAKFINKEQGNKFFMRHPEGTRAEDVKCEPYPFNASVKSPKDLNTLESRFFAFAQNDAKDKNRNKLINLSTYRLINFKKPAFTLSEVLITLGVIGIVAVLTIPPVMKNYRNKLYASQLEKLYAQISDSVQASMLDEHTSNFYETIAAKDNSCSDAANGKCEEGAGYFLNKYFKILKRDCGAGSCYANAYQQMGVRKNVDDVMGGDYCIQTTGASTICMKKDTDEETKKVTYIFNVDINGTAEPNEAGRDAFTMKVIESGAIKDVSTSVTDCGEPSAKGCLLRIMDDGWKMNY